MIRVLQEFLPRKLRNSLREKTLVRRAAAQGKVFHCRALAGESDYNICINSDMTVSCNCQDFDGSGHLGDLRLQSLPEIFSGATASGFRNMLVSCSFPTPTCVNCSDLELVSPAEGAQGLTDYRVPYKGIMVENTAACNLRCPMCDREGLLQLRSGKHSLTLPEVEKIALLLKEHRLRTLMYFNLGEPFLPPDIDQQLEVIRRHNPDLRIVTSSNGQLLGDRRRIEAAMAMDYLYISLDGVSEESVSRYQVGASFEKGYRNLAGLVAERDRRGNSRLVIEWKYVLFRWNDHPKQIGRAVELARSAKVDVIGFYRGDGPLRDRSRRWYYHPYLKKLGQRKGDRITVNLNGIEPHLLSP
jgi:uncharacterized Fe-S cluster-containing radical SAM superfamily protein